MTVMCHAQVDFSHGQWGQWLPATSWQLPSWLPWPLSKSQESRHSVALPEYMLSITVAPHLLLGNVGGWFVDTSAPQDVYQNLGPASRGAEARAGCLLHLKKSEVGIKQTSLPLFSKTVLKKSSKKNVIWRPSQHMTAHQNHRIHHSPGGRSDHVAWPPSRAGVPAERGEICNKEPPQLGPRKIHSRCTLHLQTHRSRGYLLSPLSHSFTRTKDNQRHLLLTDWNLPLLAAFCFITGGLR